MMKKYIDYIKNNPQKLWFKRKLYGWGWTPVTWQGWLVIVVFISFVVGQEYLFFEFTTQSTTDLLLLVLNIFFGALAMLLVCRLKGEKPRWQWGIPKEEKEK